MHKNTCKINKNTTINVHQYEINDVRAHLHAGIQYKSSGKTYNVTFSMFTLPSRRMFSQNSCFPYRFISDANQTLLR